MRQAERNVPLLQRVARASTIRQKSALAQSIARNLEIQAKIKNRIPTQTPQILEDLER